MKFTVELFISALALAIFIEGLMYTVFADKMPDFFSKISELSPATLRKFGFAAMLIATLTLWFITKNN